MFTILVFFLLVNSGTSEVLQHPKQITLPDSVTEAKPRETVVIFIGVDGPDFDGHEVNFAELVKRQRAYLDQEQQSSKMFLHPGGACLGERSG